MNFQMDISVIGKSSRRELQGFRPTPLRVHKDSHKIRKPPTTAPFPPPLPPPPVIIYTLSPKIIHADPSEFMTLVQRLTGPDSAVVPLSSSSMAFPDGGCAVSSAARFASVENIRRNIPHGRNPRVAAADVDAERSGYFTTGVLSPTPASLRPIPPSFFPPPPSDHQNSLGLFPDYLSPPNLFISPTPGTPSTDLLNNLFDLQH